MGAGVSPAGAAIHPIHPIHPIHKTTTTTTKSKSKKHSGTTSTTTTPTPTTAPAAPGTTPTTTVSPADTELIRAIGAEAKIGSVRISGTIHQGKTLITLNLRVNGDGEGGGTFVQSGSKIQLKRVGPLLYFNAPKKFWAAHSTKSQTKLYGGKWIEVSALDSRFQSFDNFLDAGELVSAVFQGHTTPLELSKPTTLGGHKVVIISDTIKVGRKTTTGLMYVITTGSPVVLRIVDKSPTQNGLLNFSDYARPVSITIPPEPINLTSG
jgi:hypothetical protein